MARSPKSPAPGVADASAAFSFDGFALDAAGALPSDQWTPHRPDRGWVKLEGGRRFRVQADYEPASDQRSQQAHPAYRVPLNGRPHPARMLNCGMIVCRCHEPISFQST